jgi:hypothetical protein
MDNKLSFQKHKLDLEKVKFLQQNLEKLNEYEKRAYDNGLQWGFTVTSKKHQDYYDTILVRLGYYERPEVSNLDEVTNLQKQLGELRKLNFRTQQLLEKSFSLLQKYAEKIDDLTNHDDFELSV